MSAANAQITALSDALNSVSELRGHFAPQANRTGHVLDRLTPKASAAIPMHPRSDSGVFFMQDLLLYRKTGASVLPRPV